MDKLLVIRVMLKGTLPVHVMHWQYMRIKVSVIATMMRVIIVLMIAMLSICLNFFVMMVQIESFRLITGQSMMSMPMSRFSFAMDHLELLRLSKVHTESVTKTSGTFFGIINNLIGISILIVRSSLMMITFLNGVTMTLIDMIVVIDIKGVTGLASELPWRRSYLIHLVIWVIILGVIIVTLMGLKKKFFEIWMMLLSLVFFIATITSCWHHLIIFLAMLIYLVRLLLLKDIGVKQKTFLHEMRCRDLFHVCRVFHKHGRILLDKGP